MRLGVLDIGSNTVHLLVVDAKARVRPDPFLDQRSVVRLMQYMDDEGRISDEGVDALVAAIRRAVIFARDSKVDQLMGIITSAIRESPNGDEVMKILEDEAGTTFKVLSGTEEAELTFLAARRWHGWAAGRLMVLDIGGGSFEVAVGINEEPEFVASIPLGAGRLTKMFLDQELPTRDQIKDLRKYVKQRMSPLAEKILELERPDHVVATSKTFRSLARLAGQQVAVVGPEERRRMGQNDLKDWVDRLGRIPASARTELPGITPERTYQIVAGAEVAMRAMKAFKVKELEICPWALREGVLLERIDRMDAEPRSSGLNLAGLGEEQKL